MSKVELSRREEVPDLRETLWRSGLLQMCHCTLAEEGIEDLDAEKTDFMKAQIALFVKEARVTIEDAQRCRVLYQTEAFAVLMDTIREGLKAIDMERLSPVERQERDFYQWLVEEDVLDTPGLRVPSIDSCIRAKSKAYLDADSEEKSAIEVALCQEISVLEEKRRAVLLQKIVDEFFYNVRCSYTPEGGEPKVFPLKTVVAEELAPLFHDACMAPYREDYSYDDRVLFANIKEEVLHKFAQALNDRMQEKLEEEYAPYRDACEREIQAQLLGVFRVILRLNEDVFWGRMPAESDYVTVDEKRYAKKAKKWCEGWAQYLTPRYIPELIKYVKETEGADTICFDERRLYREFLRTLPEFIAAERYMLNELKHYFRRTDEGRAVLDDSPNQEDALTRIDRMLYELDKRLQSDDPYWTRGGL